MEEFVRQLCRFTSVCQFSFSGGGGGGRSRNDVLQTCKASLRGIIKFFSLVVVRDVSISLNDINFRVTGNFGLGK